MGFWKAIEEIFPATRHQRCWVHKVANVLNKVPKSVQRAMKADLVEVRDAPDRASAEDAIESVFTTVRHRTVRTMGALSHRTARLMVFKLTMAASKTWRRLEGENRLPMVIAGVKFTDGVATSATADQRAA